MILMYVLDENLLHVWLCALIHIKAKTTHIIAQCVNSPLHCWSTFGII